MSIPPRSRAAIVSSIVGLAVVVAIAGLLFFREAPATPQPPVASASAAGPDAVVEEPGDAPGEPDGVVDASDGVLPDGVAVTETDLVGIANLEPALHQALEQAAGAAAEDDIALTVTSGWRSPEYQAQLLAEAVVKYGSEEEAARWVATPETSPHVSGDAVDIGPYDAIDWLSRFGSDYGLCQIYGNEPWHFELRPEAVETGCPQPYLDPTEDPRLR